MPKKSALAVAADHVQELCMENDRLRDALRLIASRRPARGFKMESAFLRCRLEARKALENHPLKK